MKKIIFLFFFLIAAAAQSQTINRVKLMGDIQTLSSEKYEGRKTGTAGNKLAAEYINNRFNDIGLRSYRENFTHHFTFKTRQNEDKQGNNLIGLVQGKSDNVIVLFLMSDV